MATAQGRTAEINRMIEELLMQTHRMKGYEKLERMRQAGTQKYLAGLGGIEEQRGASNMAKLQQQFINEIATFAPIKRLSAQIFQDRQTGKDTSELEEQLKAEIEATSKAGLQLSSGEPLTPESARAISQLSDVVFASLVGQSAQTWREKEKLKFGREELGVEKRKVGVSEAKLGVEREREGRLKKGKYYTNIHDKVEFAMTYLKGLKEVDPEALTVGDLLDMDSNQAMMLSGLMGGALTRENLGRLMSRLSTIDTKAMRGDELTESELNEVDSAYNIFQKQTEFERGDIQSAIDECVRIVMAQASSVGRQDVNEATVRANCEAEIRSLRAIK